MCVRAYVYVSVCLRLFVRSCANVCGCIHVCVCVRASERTFVLRCVCASVSECMCVFVWACVCLCVRVLVCECV